MLSTLRNLFVPNPANNHKALLIQNYGLFLLLVFLLGLHISLFIWNRPNLNILGTSTDLTPEKIIELTNQARLDNGLQALQHEKQLDLAAQAKLDDMFEFNYWDHYSPSKRAPWKFILQNGYSYKVAGENLGKDFHSSQKLVEAWLESPGHRANLLNSEYMDIGVAVGSGEIDDKPAILIVQFFGTRATQVTVVGPDDPIFDTAGAITYTLTEKEADPLITTQTIALITIIALGLVLTIDAFILHKYKKIPRVSAKYWAHMVFLYAIGIATLCAVN